MTLTVSNLPSTLNPGYHLVTVIAGGIPSEARIVELICSLAITQHPTNQTGAIGSSATFTVATQGGRRFQWQQDGVDIPGANGPPYTTPPITAADAGTTYQVVVDSGCMSEVSNPGTLIVEDLETPNATVLSPSGGEYWLLSDPDPEPDEPPNSELVTWEMSDNIRICLVEVSLLYSDDGVTYHEAPAGGGLPKVFGEGGVCRHPGVENTFHEYILPIDPPSGTETSRYKIRLRVTDQAGNTTETESARSFHIARPNPDAVKTLILANFARMSILADEEGLLRDKLQDLADHEDVRGLVEDLGTVTDIGSLYDDWDLGQIDANDVLFGPDGIHDHLLDVVATFPGVEYVIVVGDDRIIPMARVSDGTWRWPEEKYIQGGDLTAGTTVGQALAANQYLSDDLLAELTPIRPEDVNTRTHLPDLALGRLVETPQEIMQAITVFLNHNGILDLTLPAVNHKVLVTGYDFLIDSAKRVCRKWKNNFGVVTPCPADDIAPVDGQLISTDWGEEFVEDRRDALLTHLGGNGGERYRIANLNGHATHYEEGVPGTDRSAIAGVDAAEIYGLDLAGSVVYAVGCHGGLPVAGTDDPADHPLDLPQTMLARGVQAYVANSGFGWGLLDGIGYSEHLVRLFTDRLMEDATVVVGKAVVDAKHAYYQESPWWNPDDPQRLSPYDEKTVTQWTFFGFPNYAVKTGATPAKSTSGLFRGPARRPGERPAEEDLGGVTVTRGLSGSGVDKASSLPPYLTRLELRFDLSAPEIYTKYNAAGDELADDPGCPPAAPGESEGCYYTLNGLATGVADLPIQPYLVYDSRLSGTSQHGVLWLGGIYREQEGWTPIFGQPVSNEPEGEYDRGSTPETIIIRPRGPGFLGESGCASADLEMATVVLTCGETLWSQTTDSYDLERRYDDVELEVFYFNNTRDGTGNCDRLGPDLEAGPFAGDYHQADGATIEWAVPAADDDPGEDDRGVWRVLVVYTDNTVDADGRGAWVPLELAHDGSGTWRGSVTLPETSRVTYVIQAVDRRGNVSWLDWETELPDSGVAHGIPEPIEVELMAGRAYLSVTLADAPDPVMARAPLQYTIEVHNAGPAPAIFPEVSLALADGLTYGLAGGDGWNCDYTDTRRVVTCGRDTLPLGPAAPISVFVTVPAVGGIIASTVTVGALNSDRAEDSEPTLVIDDNMTDLGVVKEDGGVVAVPGGPLTYWITVTNHGPNAASGATVTDYFSADLHSVAWSCWATAGSSCTESGGGDVVDSVDLLVGGTLVYTATAIVDDDAVSDLRNLARVEPPPTMIDYNRENDESVLRTPLPAPGIFADGFESGDWSAWSSARKALVIRLADETPKDPGRYRGSFTLDLPAKGDEPQVVLVIDEDGKELVTFGVLVRDGKHRLLGRIRFADGAKAETELVELSVAPHVVEIERSSGEAGTADGSFAMWIDGVPISFRPAW